MRPPIQSVLTLADVLITGVLAHRPVRESDGHAEVHAVRELSQLLADAPQHVPQRAVTLAVVGSRAGSAGVSIVEPGTPPLLRWQAVAGALAPHTGQTLALDASPGGVALAQGTPQLFAAPARYFPRLRTLRPPIVESLVVPLTAAGRPLGTLWVATHTPHWSLDRTVAELLQSLGAVVAGALQLTRALATAQGHSRLHIEHMTEAFFATDQRLQFTAVNRPATRVWRMAEDVEVVGRGMMAVFPEARDTVFAQHFRAVLETQTARSYEAYYAPLETWCAQHVVPTAEGLAVYWQDITVRKRVEAALADAQRTLASLEVEYQIREEEVRAQLEAVVDAAAQAQQEYTTLRQEQTTLTRLRWAGATLAQLPLAVAVLDAQLIIRFWNRAAQRFWGVWAEEAHGQSLLSLACGLPSAALEELLDACRSGPPGRVCTAVVTATTRTGRHLDCRVACAALQPEAEPGRGFVLTMELQAMAEAGEE